MHRHRRIAQLLIAADASGRLRYVLELGIVVAIVMLLITLALRSFETYVVRAQLSEAFLLTSTIRGEMVTYRAQHGEWPRTKVELSNSTLNEELYLGQFVDHIVLQEGGAISIFFGTENTASALDGRQLTLRPMLAASSPGSPLFWACAKYRAPDGFVPGGLDNTDIEFTQLPSACREY